VLSERLRNTNDALADLRQELDEARNRDATGGGGNLPGSSTGPQ
jgi:hypothetical protein